MPTYTTLQGITDISKKSADEILEDNVIEFLKWGFIDVGAFFNIVRDTSGVYSGEYDNLVCTRDPNYTAGQVWSSFRRDWIWESGTAVSEPIRVSGVYVDGVYHPTGDAGYEHYYDYPNGRVIFNTAISPTAQVEVEYSYRWINVVNSDVVPFLRTNQNSFRNEFQTYNSGIYDVGQVRLDLPCIAVDVPPMRSTRGYELGSPSRVSLNSISLHVLGEDGAAVKRIASALADQKEKTIHMFDSNEIADSGDFPLDYRGMTTASPKSYPQLVALNANGGYRWNKLFIENTTNTNYQKLSQNLFISTVKLDTEVILPI